MVDFRKIISNADLRRFSAAVIVEYGVFVGLDEVTGVKPRKLNEFVFLRMDLRGNDPM